MKKVAAAAAAAAETEASAATSPSLLGDGGDLADRGLEPMPDLPPMPGVPRTLANMPTISTPEIQRRLNQISNSLNAGPPIEPVDAAMPQAAEDPTSSDSAAPMDIGANQPEGTPLLGAAVDAGSSSGSSSDLLVPLDVGGGAGGISVPGPPQGYCGIGLVTPEDLYRHLGDPDNDGRRLLLIDIRDADDFRVSHIEYECRVNIPPSWLVEGMIAAPIEGRLKRKMRRHFGDRHQYETVVLVGLDPGDIVHPPRDYRILIDALLQYEPSKKLKRPPLCVAGGYLNFHETYPSSCSGAPRRAVKAPVAAFSVPAMAYPTAPKISSQLLVVEDLPPSPEPVPLPSVDLHVRRLSSSATPKVPMVPKPAKSAAVTVTVQPPVPIADQWAGENVGAGASAADVKLATQPQQTQPLAPAPAPPPLVDLGVAEATTVSVIAEAPSQSLLDFDFGSPVPTTLLPAELTRPKRMPPGAPAVQPVSAVPDSRPLLNPLEVHLPVPIVTGYEPSAPAALPDQPLIQLQQDQQPQAKSPFVHHSHTHAQPPQPLLDMTPTPEPMFFPPAAPEPTTPPQTTSVAYAVPVLAHSPAQQVFQPPVPVPLPSRLPPAPLQTPTRVPPQTVPVAVAAYVPPISGPGQQPEEGTWRVNPPITPPEETTFRFQPAESNPLPLQQQRPQQQRPQQQAVKPSRLPPHQPIAKPSRLPPHHVKPTRPPQSRPPPRTPSYDKFYRPPQSSTSIGSGQLGRSSIPSKENRPLNRPSVNRGVKPAAAGSGRLSQEMRNARMQSMDAVFGSPCQALTGLRNIGNTCFMNCVLQCMVATTPLVKYFVQGRVISTSI